MYQAVCFLCLVLINLVPFCLPSQVGGKAENLGTGLASLRVVSVDRSSKTVNYVPAKVLIVDQVGKSKDRFDVIPIDNTKVLVSGSVALRADSSEITTLKQQAESILGRGVQVMELPPTSYSILITAGGKTLFSLPASSGVIKPVPIQEMITKPTNGAGVMATFHAAITYRETLAAVGLTLTVDWKKLVAEIQMRASGNEIDSKNIDEILRHSGETGSIKVEFSGSGSMPSFDFLLPYLESAVERILQPQPDKAFEPVNASTAENLRTKGFSDLQTRYSIRTDLESLTKSERISMETTQLRYRSVLIIGDFTLYP